MSVMQLRRDMRVEKEPVVEIETPFPLRKIETIDIDAAPVLANEDHPLPRKSFLSIVRGWAIGLGLLAVLAAYPVMVVLGSDVGDREMVSIDRAQWTAPWAGGASVLMERHFSQLGWASDAPRWAPMARLTAKPAFQTAVAESVGDYIGLMHRQAVGKDAEDADLSAAARLVTAGSTGVQLRAARDALMSYDRRLRRRGVQPVATPEQIAGQLGLIESWATRSQSELKMTAQSQGLLPIDESATVAVYKAKGRAVAAYAFLDTMLWPEDPKAAAARTAALNAWKAAAQFHPLVVLNGSPDGSLFGNHATSMGFLVGQAQQATEAYRAAVAAASPAKAVADAAPAAAVAPATAQ